MDLSYHCQQQSQKIKVNIFLLSHRRHHAYNVYQNSKNPSQPTQNMSPNESLPEYNITV